MSLIETHQLTKAYGFLPVLKKLDFSVERGEFVALLGPNGSGKSTLIRLLCALIKPSSGKIVIGGWSLPNEAASVLPQIGLVSHKVLLYENLSARENLHFFGRLYNLEESPRKARVETLLKQVGLARRGDDLVRNYSRGMQQRLSIARALLHNPDILLFDEPHTGLDQSAALMLDELMLSAQANGRTILMSTHDLDRAQTIANRAVILSKGVIGFDQPTTSLQAGELAQTYTAITGLAQPERANI